MSRDICLQHHTQENLWVLAVLAGNPDNAPIQNQLLATDHRKLNTKNKGQTKLNHAKTHTEGCGKNTEKKN